jgi:hypothetical protein
MSSSWVKTYRQDKVKCENKVKVIGEGPTGLSILVRLRWETIPWSRVKDEGSFTLCILVRLWWEVMGEGWRLTYMSALYTAYSIYRPLYPGEVKVIDMVKVIGEVWRLRYPTLYPGEVKVIDRVKVIGERWRLTYQPLYPGEVKVIDRVKVIGEGWRLTYRPLYPGEVKVIDKRQGHWWKVKNNLPASLSWWG